MDSSAGEDLSSHHVVTNEKVVVDDIPQPITDPPTDTGTVSTVARQGQRTRGIFGTDYREPKQPGGTKLKRKQTRRVKKKLRNTINKISKMTHKNKTKRRRKNRHKTRKS